MKDKKEDKIIEIVKNLQAEIKSLSEGKDINKKFFKEFIEYTKQYNSEIEEKLEQTIKIKELCKSKVRDNCLKDDKELYETELGNTLIREIQKDLKAENKKNLIENSMGFLILLQKSLPDEKKVMLSLESQNIDEKTKAEIIKKIKEATKSKSNKKGLPVIRI